VQNRKKTGQQTRMEKSFEIWFIANDNNKSLLQAQ
jgi:hypothetical protein